MYGEQINDLRSGSLHQTWSYRWAIWIDSVWMWLDLSVDPVVICQFKKMIRGKLSLQLEPSAPTDSRVLAVMSCTSELPFGWNALSIILWAVAVVLSFRQIQWAYTQVNNVSVGTQPAWIVVPLFANMERGVLIPGLSSVCQIVWLHRRINSRLIEINRSGT